MRESASSDVREVDDGEWEERRVLSFVARAGLRKGVREVVGQRQLGE